MSVERFKYINHLGETLYFGQDNIVFANMNDLHDFDWDVISQRERISGFDRGMRQMTIPIRIGAADPEDGYKKMNQLFEIPEKDVIANKPGRLILNGYWLQCFVTASHKTFYSVDGHFLSTDIEITTDQPFWIFDRWPTEYGVVNPNYITNDSFSDAEFTIEIDGEVSNPALSFGGNLYRVYTDVGADETLVIDSLSEKAYIKDENGYTESVFQYRDKEHWIFEKVPVGSHQQVNKSSGVTDYRIILHYERSEPKWISEGANQELTWRYGRVDPDGIITETSYIYSAPSGITLAINANGHLIETKSDDYSAKNLMNHFELKDGRLLVYHD